MNSIIDAVFKLLDVILDKADKLAPEEAAEARARILAGINERAARISADEAGDLAAIPR